MSLQDGVVPLTFSLDFKDADGILRVERPDLARRERVPPLDSRRDGRWRLHQLDERLRARNGHRARPLFPAVTKLTPRSGLRSRSAGSPLSDPAGTTEGFLFL